MSDDLGDTHPGACCGVCRHAAQPRPRLVIGIFNDAREADGAAERLRTRAVGAVSVLAAGLPLLSQDIDSTRTGMLMACNRLYQQVTQHLQSGASIVIVDAHSAEQQVGVSRVLLESKCALLLTHDDSRHVTAE